MNYKVEGEMNLSLIHILMCIRDSTNTVSQIEEINKNIKKCEVHTDNKLSEISVSCETEIQLLHDTVKNINQKCIQSECSNDRKFNLVEQNINSVKDELQVAISQKMNNITERILVTRDVNNDIELESFSHDSRGGTPYAVSKSGEGV